MALDAARFEDGLYILIERDGAGLRLQRSGEASD
jgi:hypothetical protein